MSEFQISKTDRDTDRERPTLKKQVQWFDSPSQDLMHYWYFIATFKVEELRLKELPFSDHRY